MATVIFPNASQESESESGPESHVQPISPEARRTDFTVKANWKNGNAWERNQKMLKKCVTLLTRL